MNDRGTRVCFCRIPSHCGIEGNERVDQLPKESLDQDIDPLASIHYTDLKPLVNYFFQQLVQTKWDVAVHGRDLYLVKATLGQPKKFQHQSWRGCDHPTSNWPYQGHQVPYLVPRTTSCLSPLWSNIEHWPYAPRVCSITGMSWQILHSWPIECPLWDNSQDLHGGIPMRSGILLSDMIGQTFYTIHDFNHPRSDGIC